MYGFMFKKRPSLMERLFLIEEKHKQYAEKKL
jgi:hypothetical protein